MVTYSFVPPRDGAGGIYGTARRRLRKAIAETITAFLRVCAFAMMIGLLLTPARATAASCCGGASNADAFGLSKWNKALVGLSIGTSQTADLRDAEGDRLTGLQWESRQATVTLGAGYRLAENWQTGLTFPVAGQEVQAGSLSGRGYGVGDVGAQLRYELMDEETCFALPVSEMRWDEVKPSIHVVLRTLWPTGRSTGESEDAMGASVHGRGLYAADGGLEITKIWGRFGNALSATGGYQLPTAAEETAMPQAYRWSASAGQLFYFAYQTSLGAFISHRQEIGIGSEAFRVQSTDASLVGTYVHEQTWWFRATAGARGQIQGKNTPTGWTGTMAFARLF